jgi:hypothetical protein
VICTLFRLRAEDLDFDAANMTTAKNMYDSVQTLRHKPESVTGE